MFLAIHLLGKVDLLERAEMVTPVCRNGGLPCSLAALEEHARRARKRWANVGAVPEVAVRPKLPGPRFCRERRADRRKRGNRLYLNSIPLAISEH